MAAPKTSVVDLGATAIGPRVATMKKFVESHPLLRPGTLALYDPSWKDRPDERTTLAQGDRMYNHAWRRAQLMIPSESQANLDGYWNVNATTAQVQSKRGTLANGKPGSYVGYTRQGVTAASAQIGIINVPVWNYMLANMSHSFFIGVALTNYLTDPGTPTGTINQNMAMVGLIGSGADIADIRPTPTGSVLTAVTATNRIGVRTMSRAVGTKGVVDGAWSSIGTPIGTQYLQRWSFNGITSGGDGLNRFPCYGWSCMVFEDMTVSAAAGVGGTYNDIDSALQTWHTKENVTVGGRYVGETIPAYATIAW